MTLRYNSELVADGALKDGNGDTITSTYAKSANLATVATSGDYDDLTDKPKVKGYSATNPALTATSDICTWVVTHNLGNTNVAPRVYEVTSGDEVMCNVNVTSNNSVTIKLFSTSNIAAGAYRVVITECTGSV